MNGDFWRSEVVVFGLMFLNMAAVATGVVWAWRRGYLTNLDDESTGLHRAGGPLEDTRHG